MPLDLVEHDLKVLGELHDLIELGPHWDTIKRIEVLRVHLGTATELTVGQTAQS